MKGKLPLTVRFMVNCFLIAVVANASVSAAHIIKEKDSTFLASLLVFLFTLSTSAVFFAGICILLYLLGLLAGMGREKTFWLLMIIGLAITVIAYRIFKEVFYKYTEPGYIAGIAAFSIMVGLASQYQLFHQVETHNKNRVISG